MTQAIFAGCYRSLFEDLPPLRSDAAALHALGRPGGVCDLGEGVVENTDSEVAAVWPFFGQFLAHDITADRSPLVDRADTARIHNFRAPRANLEALYGNGPVGEPYLYAADDPAKLLLAPSGIDVPRNQEGIALIGDPRNDANLFTSQMAVAFIGLHNRFVDRLRADRVPEAEVYAAARRETTWHFQHVILREFLPGLIGGELTAELLEDGPRLYRIDPDDPYIPLEFADAAYRYGHAQIRDRYQVNASFGPVPVFPDLMGFGPVRPERRVDWALQFAQRAKRIDARLPASLITLPRAISGAAPGTDYASLATRDLQRGHAVGLPSGEAVARRIGVEVLEPAAIGLGWEETPLWFYVLKEAEVLGGGNQLGPVGGRIVGEVVVGVIDADPSSFRVVDPSWTPGVQFGLASILGV
ncbi:hypothetical protein OJ998_20240 [Solirubrobacter taibaiensis]|nr:hypothetical protein [Solirubrobacter taibaiensis]